MLKISFGAGLRHSCSERRFAFNYKLWLNAILRQIFRQKGCRKDSGFGAFFLRTPLKTNVDGSQQNLFQEIYTGRVAAVSVHFGIWCRMVRFSAALVRTNMGW
jgi:hypothetical protein